jgi:hypothetical protein
VTRLHSIQGELGLETTIVFKVEITIALKLGGTKSSVIPALCKGRDPSFSAKIRCQIIGRSEKSRNTYLSGFWSSIARVNLF